MVISVAAALLAVETAAATGQLFPTAASASASSCGATYAEESWGSALLLKASVVSRTSLKKEEHTDLAQVESLIGTTRAFLGETLTSLLQSWKASTAAAHLKGSGGALLMAFLLLCLLGAVVALWRYRERQLAHQMYFDDDDGWKHEYWMKSQGEIGEKPARHRRKGYLSAADRIRAQGGWQRSDAPSSSSARRSYGEPTEAEAESWSEKLAVYGIGAAAGGALEGLGDMQLQRAGKAMDTAGELEQRIEAAQQAELRRIQAVSQAAQGQVEGAVGRIASTVERAPVRMFKKIDHRTGRVASRLAEQVEDAQQQMKSRLDEARENA
jgi:hypothetical protein